MSSSWPPDADNLRRSRFEVMMRCRHDAAYAAIVKRRCADDIIYFLETFGWVENRQAVGMAATDVMLLCYPQQKEYILHLVEVLKEAAVSETFRHNEIVDKARKTAGTWSTLLVFIWFWCFHNASFQILSKKEDDVDKDGDLDTPFEKMRFFLRRLPDFLLPEGFDINSRRWSKQLLLKSPAGGQIAGGSSAASSPRQKRALAILFDEFAYCENDEAIWASGSGTAKVRIAVSTPNGMHNKFYRLRWGKEKEKIHLTSFTWQNHPVFGKDKQQKADGSWTSPWYEATKAAESAQTMAKEYDLNYADSIGSRIFFMYGKQHEDPELVPHKESKIIRIWDWGLCCAILWGEYDKSERFLIYKEYVVEQNAVLENVCEAVLEITAELCPDNRIEDIGDPADFYRRSVAQEESVYQIMQRKYGIYVRTQSISNVPPQKRTKQSINILKDAMTSFVPDMKTTKLVINPTQCPKLQEALAGAYAWEVDKNGQVIEDKPAKGHPYEDVADNLRYLALHAHSGTIRSGGKTKLHIVKEEGSWRPPSARKKAANDGWKKLDDGYKGRDTRGRW